MYLVEVQGDAFEVYVEFCYVVIFGFFIEFGGVEQCFGWDVIDVEVGVVECCVCFGIGGVQVKLCGMDCCDVIVGVCIDYEDVIVVVSYGFCFLLGGEQSGYVLF